MKRIFAFLVLSRLPKNDRETSLKKVGNSFQNLDRTRERFSEFAFDPFSGLAASEIDRFRRRLSARHVVGHNLGVVDEKYAASGAPGRVGEALVLRREDVEWFAENASGVLLRTGASFSEFRMRPHCP